MTEQETFLTEARDAAEAAKRIARAELSTAEDELRSAKLALGEYHIQSAGIEFDKTRVTITPAHSWGNVNTTEYFVRGLDAVGRAVVCKIKKDGTPSAAGSGVYSNPEVSQLVVVPAA